MINLIQYIYICVCVCDGHTMGYLGEVGRVMYIRARAPPVAVCLVNKWRENLLISRAARPHVQFVRQVCRESDVYFICVFVSRTIYIAAAHAQEVERRQRFTDRYFGMLILCGVIPGTPDGILVCDLSTDAIIETDTLGSILPHTLDIKNGLLFTEGGVSLQLHHQDAALSGRVFTLGHCSIPPYSEAVLHCTTHTVGGRSLPSSGLLEGLTVLRKKRA